MTKHPYTIAAARAKLGISRTTILYHLGKHHFGRVDDSWYEVIDGRNTLRIPAKGMELFLATHERTPGVDRRWRAKR